MYTHGRVATFHSANSYLMPPNNALPLTPCESYDPPPLAHASNGGKVPISSSKEEGKQKKPWYHVNDCIPPAQRPHIRSTRELDQPGISHPCRPSIVILPSIYLLLPPPLFPLLAKLTTHSAP